MRHTGHHGERTAWWGEELTKVDSRQLHPPSSHRMRARGHHRLLMCMRHHPNLTRGVRPYAFVENVVTRADARGHGYATACLNHAKALAQQAGCYKMMLLTGSMIRRHSISTATPATAAPTRPRSSSGCRARPCHGIASTTVDIRLASLDGGMMWLSTGSERRMRSSRSLRSSRHAIYPSYPRNPCASPYLVLCGSR